MHSKVLFSSAAKLEKPEFNPKFNPKKFLLLSGCQSCQSTLAEFSQVISEVRISLIWPFSFYQKWFKLMAHRCWYSIFYVYVWKLNSCPLSASIETSYTFYSVFRWNLIICACQHHIWLTVNKHINGQHRILNSVYI